jgi:hypothetical protein
MNSFQFIKIDVKTSTAFKPFSVYIPISSISYLEKITPSNYFIFFKEDVNIRGIMSGDMITLDPEKRKQIGLNN